MFQTFAEVERQHQETMMNEWEREKQKILNTLLGSGPDAFEFPAETEVSPNCKPRRSLSLVSQSGAAYSGSHLAHFGICAAR